MDFDTEVLTEIEIMLSLDKIFKKITLFITILDYRYYFIRGMVVRGMIVRGMVIRGMIVRGVVVRGMVVRGMIVRGMVVRRMVIRGMVVRGMVVRAIILSYIPIINEFDRIKEDKFSFFSFK